MPDVPPGFDPRSGSLACAAGDHARCGHVSLAARRPVSRRRLQSVIALCQCSCHAACPLAGRRPVPLTVWQQLCGCPGAERKRAWTEEADRDFPDFAEYRERSRQRSEQRKDAFEAARSAAPGKTRDEVRDLYLAELRARGLERPPEAVLEAILDALTGHRWRAQARLGAAVIEFIRRLRGGPGQAG